MTDSLSQITLDFIPPENNAHELLSGRTDVYKEEKIKNTRGRKPLKEKEEPEPVEIPEDEILFKKLYYSISEVAAMLKETTSLIRFWEKEFDVIEARKNRKGDRFFSPEDVKNLYLVYDLVRRRKYTIEGAKEYLRKNKHTKEKFAMIQSLQRIKSFLLELKADL